MSKTQRGCIPWLFEEISVNACTHGPMGASGRTVEVLVASNVQAVIDFSYSPAEPARGMDDGCPAEVAIRSIKTTQGAIAHGEHMALTIDAGYDLLELLHEREVEKLEEMIIQRAENKQHYE